MIQVAESANLLTRLGGPRNVAGMACLAVCLGIWLGALLLGAKSRLAACGLWVLGFAMGVVGLALLIGALASGSALAWVVQQRFDHWQHRALFPTCVGCHAGAAEPGAALWPAPASCAECHDNAVQKAVEWTPRAGPRASNLKFTHSAHADAVRRLSPDSTLQCRACHTEPGADPMQVELAVVRNCLDCHGVKAGHLEAPDSACVTCHVPLVRAVSLTRDRVARFPAPASHQAPGFIEQGHGKEARAGKGEVAASCATCHARDFCTECHVNAPEVQAIQALEPDARSLAISAQLFSRSR